ncbi:uncharacterized protein C8Q71DRAFT_377375 [Rhodofomes roseus]|uniref:SET domain-containing protein n=1 Tax=Rhodofomes roseus TaxID=34475 RepID=A0ABQ8K0A9_9APHY|nr:uncharacterized protein C8Q71DRAFT_377375 [Rhodofomes roseus]KAH9830089.1 hypothetical protein C8Q71DRAFT_377375 [Rhodofomes roseus]
MEGPLIDDTRRLDDEDTYDAEQQVAQQSRAIAERLLAQENERNTVVEVYRDAWRDFYNWEPEPCSSLIRSLAPAHIEWDEVTAVPLDIPAESMVVDEVVTSLFRVFDLERDRLTVLDEEFIRTPDFAPHPKYEACTPTMHIIKSDEETDWLRFITYAGDPGFAEQDLLRDHKRYNWQDGIRDPDADLIGLEAIHRLEGRSLSYDTVDAHSVLPRLLGHNGLIWRMSHRDLWHWPELPELLHVPLDDHTLKTQVNEYVDKICPHMGCLNNLCFPHKEVTEPFFGNNVHVNSQVLKQKVQTPCGDMCCVMDRDIIGMPSMAEMQLIQDILSLLPDETPCILASIVRLPCYQVYMQRCQLFPDYSIKPVRQPNLVPLISHFNDEGETQAAGIDFCYHQGPCGTQCPCYKAKMHCKRNCRCSEKCQLRAKGCKCQKPEICKNTERCPCRKALRECDPEMCGPSKLRKKGRRHQCPNTHLQQATYPQLIVKNGQHGQGTFANVDIGKDTVIGEYIAELFPNELSHFLHALFTHRHLNYTFNVNVRDVLDAAWVGNETRYMNHAKGKAENITAHMKWVDGELRIAFSSTKRIKKGNELLFDYGTEYWKDHEQEP